MKKLILVIACAIMAVGSMSAQTAKGEKEILFKGGLVTDPTNLVLGAEGRYGITENIRLAPSALFYIPKNSTMGLLVDVNAQYVFPIQEGLSLYPLAGLAMHNFRTSAQNYAGILEVPAHSFTNWGFNIGVGADYNLSAKTFISGQFQYTFSDWDHAAILVGYGMKF